MPLKTIDPEIYEVMRHEIERQRTKLNLIASENYASRAVLEAQGSVMTNKYAEGYPGKRYYGGCEFVDSAQNLAIERAKKLFRGRAYQCTAAFGFAGEYGCLFCNAQVRGYDNEYGSIARGPSFPWQSCEFFREIIQDSPVWCFQADKNHRLR